MVYFGIAGRCSLCKSSYNRSCRDPVQVNIWLSVRWPSVISNVVFLISTNHPPPTPPKKKKINNCHTASLLCSSLPKVGNCKFDSVMLVWIKKKKSNHASSTNNKNKALVPKFWIWLSILNKLVRFGHMFFPPFYSFWSHTLCYFPKCSHAASAAANSCLLLLMLGWWCY